MRLADYVIVIVLIGAGVWISTHLGAGSPDPTDKTDAQELASIEARLQAIESLEARVAALEAAPIREGAPPPDAWTDADVAALRVGLQRIKAGDQRDREAQRFRQVVAHVIPDAEPNARAQTVTLLHETAEAVRKRPQEAEALRTELVTQLKAMFPEAIATRLAGLVPGIDPSEEAR